MPSIPIWYARLDEIVAQLRALESPWVDRQAVEQIFAVGRRRANQILAPVVRRQIGRSGIADREEFIAHVQRLAAGEAAQWERQRRRKLAEQLDTLRRVPKEQPVVLVEAPVSILNQQLETLPEGVVLGPGEIRIQFETPTQALEKLLALAMAVGNDHERFELMASR
jgi:hypothetical protein